jgi:hypothetical protein
VVLKRRKSTMPLILSAACSAAPSLPADSNPEESR